MITLKNRGQLYLLCGRGCCNIPIESTVEIDQHVARRPKGHFYETMDGVDEDKMMASWQKSFGPGRSYKESKARGHYSEEVR